MMVAAEAVATEADVVEEAAGMVVEATEEAAATEAEEGEVVDTAETAAATGVTEVVVEATEEAVEATVEEVSAMLKLFLKAKNFVLQNYHLYLSRLRR